MILERLSGIVMDIRNQKYLENSYVGWAQRHGTIQHSRTLSNYNVLSLNDVCWFPNPISRLMLTIMKVTRCIRVINQSKIEAINQTHCHICLAALVQSSWRFISSMVINGYQWFEQLFFSCFSVGVENKFATKKQQSWPTIPVVTGSFYGNISSIIGVINTLQLINGHNVSCNWF